MPDGLRATADVAEMVAHAEVILMVVPTPFIASTMQSVTDQLRPEQVPSCARHAMFVAPGMPARVRVHACRTPSLASGPLQVVPRPRVHTAIHYLQAAGQSHGKRK